MRLACLSVCPSVCPIRARDSKTKTQSKTKIGVDVSPGTNKWSANFQLKRSKVKVTGRKTTQNWRHVYLRAATQAQAGPTPTAKPTPLLGLIYCRR